MNKLIKLLFILLLIVALSAAVVSCTDNGPSGDTDNTGGDTDNNGNPQIEGAELAEKIASGLKAAGTDIADAKIRYAYSAFTIRVNQINITLTFEANYNLNRKQDSEILLRVFDNQYVRNTLFVYYNAGILYYELNGSRRAIEGFGGTSTFDTFFSVITSFDMQSYFFADPKGYNQDEFPDEDDMYKLDSFSNYVSMIILGAESKSLSVIPIGENEENITVSGVALDKAKEPLNDFFQDTVKAGIGTRLDALSTMLFDIKISDIGNVGIGILNAEKLEIIIRDGAVSDLNVVFNGMQTDNINDFEVTAVYRSRTAFNDIKLTKYEDPDQNPIVSTPEQAAEYPSGYILTRTGENYLKGTVYVDILDATFYTEIKAKINTTDNTLNRILVDIRNKTVDLPPESPYFKDESVISLFYGDETLYVSLQGLMDNYIGSGVELSDLNFPKVKFTGIDLAQEISSLYSYILSFAGMDLSSGASLIGLFSANSKLSALLSKVNSNGDTIEFSLDTELLTAIMGDYSSNIVEWISSKMGISEETLANLMGTDAFDGFNLKIAYNTVTGLFRISVLNGETRLFYMDLYQQLIYDTNFTVDPPEGFESADYNDFRQPEAVTMHIESELRMQGKEYVDFSKLIGIFIGDVTGRNTPFTFKTSDFFYISTDIWQQNGYSYVSSTIWFNPTSSKPIGYTAADITSAPFIKLYTSGENPEEYLIYIADVCLSDNIVTPARYRISRAGLQEAIETLLGEDNLFASSNVMEIFEILTRDANLYFGDEWITFSLAPYYSNGIRYDPLYELLGIESLLASFKVKINFFAPEMPEDEDEYLAPEIESLADVVYSSMYEAVWHDSVRVYFGEGDNAVTFLLTFQGESAKLVTGVYNYAPIAKLFGYEVSYVMVLTDVVNGTKKITELDISKLVIDPTVQNPIPYVIGVRYDDGSYGEQPYLIENFPYTRDTVKNKIDGEATIDYYIVIGKGSIAETRFLLPIEILNRRIVATEFIYNVPVVAIVNIDPYAYSLAKRADFSYDVLAAYRIMTLQFHSNNGQGAIVNETVALSWDFDESLITYRGGVYYIYTYINTLRVAMQINIYAKILDYIQVVGENKGEYTVDSLLNSTYTIPVGTTSVNEIRIYFQSKNPSVPARYRIVGTPPEGWVNTDPYCDGYYPVNLKWLYEKANNVTLDKTINPLNSGRTNINVSEFGDDIAGKQRVTLTVLSPSRRVASMPDNVQCITYLSVYQTGGIDETNTVRESVKISAIGFGPLGSATDTDGAYFIVDPYAANAYNRLPAKINITVEYAGKLIRKSYNINWVASSIIDSSGNVLNPTAEESYLVARGWIGEVSGNKQLVTMVIHNSSGAYEDLIMYNPNELDGSGNPVLIEKINGKYSITVNPYDNYKLPSSFTLIFSPASGYESKQYNTEWTMMDTSGNLIYISDGYAFPYMAGEYELTTYIAADPSSGILAQTVRLHVNVENMTVIGNMVFGISSDMDNGNVLTLPDGTPYIIVDTYSASSAALLAKLSTSQANRIGIKFLFNNKFSTDVPVIWSNLEEIKTALTSSEGSTSYENGVVTLRGTIYSGSVLEQNVSMSFAVIARTLSGIRFIRTENLVRDGIMTLDVAIKGRTPGALNNLITINLLKPYTLINLMTQYGYGSGENLDKLVTNFINEMFTETQLYFEGSESGLFPLQYELPSGIDAAAFTYAYGTTQSVVDFAIDQLSLGSCTEGFSVRLITRKDTVEENIINRYEETFNENGTLKYSNETGYIIPKSIKINYENSGEVNYANLVWLAETNHIGSDGRIALTVGQVVESIPVTLFNSPVWLYTTLAPQNEKISMTISFYLKNINLTRYNAVSAEYPGYNINNGKIVVTNIYDVYPFDVTKIPSVLTPTISSTYQIADVNNPVTFAVSWTPTDKFATDGVFDQDKINQYFNYNGYAAEATPFATATILMYNRVYQTVHLYIEVIALNNGRISHSAVTFNNNSVTIDPYVDNFGGNFVLPKDIRVTFGSTVHQFHLNSNITYRIQDKNGIWHPIANIPYTHLGHALDAIQYGTPTDILSLKVSLPDGQEIELTVNFLSRQLASVYMQNKFNKPGEDGLAQLTYYIDPYDESTYTVPVFAKFRFLAGDDVTLPISYWDMGDAASLFDSSYKLIWTPSVYMGGEYYFYSKLAGYGVAEQEFNISVVVLNRSLKNAYNTTYHFSNPVAGLVSDIPSAFNADSFVELSDSAYAQYNQFATPVLPSIVWSMTNDEIVYSGIASKAVSGLITYGAIAGEAATVTVSADRWEFFELKDVESGIIEFNPHTLKSILPSFDVTFTVTDVRTLNTYMRDETFYPLEWMTRGTDEERMMIDWGERSYADYDKLETFSIGNNDKSLRINVVDRYRYRYRQVSITSVSFGFGDGYGASNYAELVIDPINPVIPTTALAKGIDVGSGSTSEMDLGTIGVQWDGDIYNMVLAGDSRIVSANLVSADGRLTRFNVLVHYLNRVPVNIYTTERGYSTNTAVNGRYLIRSTNTTNGNVVSYFVFDPISELTYNTATGAYIMPSSVIVTYKTDYASETLRNAVNVLGRELTFSNLSWYLEKEITLSGTIAKTQYGVEEYPMITRLTKFRISYTGDNGTSTSGVYDYSNTDFDYRYNINMNVLCREVEYTSISTKVTPTDGSAAYQRAISRYYIDPYAVSLPSSVSVKFTDDSVERVYNNIVWDYDEEYLERTDVISGKIGESNPNFMNIMAFIKVRGTTLGIQFPIKPRNIDTTIPGSSGTQPLKGGKIYVLAGIDLKSQLPTSMYYKFQYNETTDVAAVPLSFSETNLYNISTARPGVVYNNVKATLGLIDKDNIEFTIEVINPTVYSIKTTYLDDIELYAQGGFIYDVIPVAINGNQYYIEGREEALLPNVVIINSEGHYLRVIDREYNIAGGYVTFYCNYTFLSSSDNGNLSGTQEIGENSDKLTLSFRVPIVTYNHTKIDEAMRLNKTVLKIPLGQTLRATDPVMPYGFIEGRTAVYNLIWDMSSLNVNVAGEYTCYGYYKTTYDNNVALTLTVIVEKQQVKDSDIQITNAWLNREYTGTVLPLVGGTVNYLTIADFLRADGTFGQVESYKIEYSLDNGNSWSTVQPVNVSVDGSGYKVRITIEDYNVAGYRIFTLTIRQKLINAGDVTFHLSDSSSASTALTYEYSGAECLPVIKGIPNGATYSVKYELWDAATETYTVARPINTGIYRMTVTIPTQRNFIATVQNFVATINVLRKSVSYEIQSEIVYSGREMDAYVIGLPQILNDMSVTYIYYDADGNLMPAGSKIKNVGMYYVTVKINGGINYPSANVGNNTNANLIMRSFRVVKKQIVLKVNTLSSEYLEPLLPLHSGVTFVDADNPALPGLQGTDTMAIFRDSIVVYWEGGTLTYKHMVGDYTLYVMQNIVHQNYEVVGYENGTYSITANAENAVVINNKAELDSRLMSLSDNDRVKWYLRAGHYGSIVINKNATVSIVGSYNLTDISEEIAVTFDSITVLQGGVTIDIVKIAAVGNTAGVNVGANAADITISRSLFYRTGNSYLTGSVAVKTATGYHNTLNMVSTAIDGFAMGAYLQGGSANIQNSVFSNNIGAVQIWNAEKIILIGNTFSYTNGSAVYIVCDVTAENLSINENTFYANIVAVKSYSAVSIDLLEVQNVFKYNSINIQNLR